MIYDLKCTECQTYSEYSCRLAHYGDWPVCMCGGERVQVLRSPPQTSAISEDNPFQVAFNSTRFTSLKQVDDYLQQVGGTLSAEGDRAHHQRTQEMVDRAAISHGFKDFREEQAERIRYKQMSRGELSAKISV